MKNLEKGDFLNRAMKDFVKNFILRLAKRLAVPIVGVTLLFAVNLFEAGKLSLIGAGFMGDFSAALYIFMQASRIKMCEKSKKAVNLKTFLGVLLRLLFIFVVFAFAVKISVDVFSLMVSGFFTFYVLFYLIGIIENLKKGDSD